MVEKAHESRAVDVYSAWLDAFNHRDWDRFTAGLAADAVFVFTHLEPDDNAPLRGKSAIVRSFTSWQSGFTSLRGEITDTIEAGDRAAVALWWTGRTVSENDVGFASCHWIRVAEDEIVEIVDYFDQKSYEAQTRG